MDTNKREAASIFEVDISIQNNTLVVGMNGGNVVALPGDRVLWRTAQDAPQFTLEFFQVASEPTVQDRKDDADIHIDVARLPRWPFSEPPPPPGGVVGPTRAFAGVLSGGGQPPTTFKYYVTVGNLRLDPIVIIDK
jgi:hypothetical protein